MRSDKSIPEVILISPWFIHQIGIDLLHNCLVKNGFKVYSISLYYFNDDEIEKISEFVHKNKPLVVGIGVNSQSLIDVIRLTKRLKKISDSFIIWGGPHPTIDPKECLKYADGVCMGDGEELIAELVKRIKAKKSLSGIKNLWFKNRGKIIKNETGDFIRDLNSLPFPHTSNDDNYQIINKIFYNKIPFRFVQNGQFILKTVTKRYCPHSCSYCINSVIKGYRKCQNSQQVKYMVE